jgi:DNA-binding CsgD family transcriptional regulator
MAVDRSQWEKTLEAIDAVETQATMDEVFAELQAFSRYIGGTTLLVGRLVNPILSGRHISAFGRSDWPKEWSRLWIERDYVLHDPITQYALKSRTTFDWNTAVEHGSTLGKRIAAEREDFALSKGVSIPITAGHLPLGIVSVGYEEAIAPQDLARLELVSFHAYNRMLELMDDPQGVVPIVRLTPRELDVLSFTAAGKTAWEISKIYSIAESTVKSHLQNIIRKTNAANKTHAVTLALRDGQIMP